MSKIADANKKKAEQILKKKKEIERIQKIVDTANKHSPRIFEGMRAAYDRADRILRSLAVLNGAGAITTLAFMDTLVAAKLGPKTVILPLTIFIIGVLIPLIAILYSAVDQHRNLMAHLRTFINVAWQRMPPSELDSKFKGMPPNDLPLLFAGGLSLVAFLAGLGVGYSRLIPFVENFTPS